MGEQEWGQWLGRFTGTNQGDLTLNIDGDSDLFGDLVISDDNDKNPSFHADADFKINGKHITGILDNFYPCSYNLDLTTSTKEQSESPKKGSITGILNKDYIKGNLEIDIGIKVSFDICKFESDKQKKCDKEMSWKIFKNWALKKKLKNPNLIFRGHSNNKYNLRTTFHRNNRRDLGRYSSEDIPTLAHHISAITGRKYNINDPEEHGELLNLAQHYGYPTPLLDWTDSPHIAAYFAFSRITKYTGNNKEKIRIFLFDAGKWHDHDKQREVRNIDNPRPSFSALFLGLRDNKRALPQQSIVTCSNIYNIEKFIENSEKIDRKKYLTKIDIPTSDRDDAMEELQYMGITEASLFPGLDGTCISLKERYF